jgi:antitoxin (DNA-binding transcriptional repressor) of toxin-antitoxin stability system
MKTVNIGELRDQLSAYLQYVRSGEEVVIRDRGVAVARILPLRSASESEEEARLVASGAMRLPQQKMDWKLFFSLPKGNVSREVAVDAAIESRGDR